MYCSSSSRVEMCISPEDNERFTYQYDTTMTSMTLSTFHTNSVCQERKWQCTTNQCHGTCAIYGDGHYMTFDEKQYMFNGDCEYILAQVNIFICFLKVKSEA